jgi:hypothetical protein
MVKVVEQKYKAVSPNFKLPRRRSRRRRRN